MEQGLAEIAGYVGLVIEAIAVLVVTYASLEALVGVIRLAVFPAMPEGERRAIWLRYLRWLVAGLTFQLAADIVHTAVAAGWEDLGRVAAIAAIRTFLGYFLERDMREARQRA